MQGYATAFQNALFSVDEIREEEGREPVGLTQHMLQTQYGELTPEGIVASAPPVEQDPDEVLLDEDDAE